MSNNLSRPLLSNQRSPRLSLGGSDSAVAKLQGLFSTLSQTAESIGNKLRIPSPRSSLSNSEAMSERVCLKELLKQEECDDVRPWSDGVSCSVNEKPEDQSHFGKHSGYSTVEEWDALPLIIKSSHEVLATGSPLQQKVSITKISSSQRVVSPTSPGCVDTSEASMLFDDSTFDYLGDINANVTDSILLSPSSDLVLYKDSPLAKVVRPGALFSTPSPTTKEEDSWIEPWYLLADTYRTDVSQALVRPMSYYLSTIPLDMTTSSFESGNGSIIDLSWDEYDMAALESPSSENTLANNRRSLAQVKTDEEILSQKKKRISVAACLRSPILSPLLQSPNSLHGCGSLRKLSQRSRRKLGTPLTLGSGRRQRRNYEDETDEVFARRNLLKSCATGTEKLKNSKITETTSCSVLSTSCPEANTRSVRLPLRYIIFLSLLLVGFIVGIVRLSGV